VLGEGTGRDAYAHAFGLAQAATSAALLGALLLSIPRGLVGDKRPTVPRRGAR
jgi:hypothetical protein